MGDSQKSSHPPVRKPAKAWPWSLLLGFAFVWFICAIYTFSNVEVDMLWLLLLVPSGFLLAIFWCVMTVLELIQRSRSAQAAASPRRWIAWIATPVLGALGLLLAWTDADLRVRVHLSDAALRAKAQQVIDAGDLGSTVVDARVGLFEIQDAELSADGSVRFTMQYPGIFTEAGLIYDPNNLVQINSGWPETTDRLNGTWVAFVWSD